MQLFYIPGLSGETAIMDPAESHHCIKVLRKGRGEKISIVDGSGGFFDAIIIDDNPKKCEVKILSEVRDYEKRDYHLHIAIAHTKSIDRFEWFLEKATEIGVDTITPLICQRSERRRLRYDRLEGILVSAMKQSIKARKPVLNEMVTLEDFMNEAYDHENCYVAHLIDGLERTGLLKAASNGSRYVVLIGPEGDFSPDEIALALQRGFRPVTLGRSRLRTETAGVVAAQIISDKVSLA